VTIEVKEGRYFAAQWFVHGLERDFLAAVYQDAGEDTWHLVYRFRYYAKGSTPHDGRDEKSWYHVKAVPDGREKKKSEAEMRRELKEKVVESVDTMCRMLVDKGFGDSCEKLHIESDDPERVSEIIIQRSYSHVAPSVFGGGEVGEA